MGGGEGIGGFRRFIGVIEVFIRRFKIFYKKYKKVIEMFYNNTYAEVHYKKKSMRSQKIKVMRRFGGVLGLTVTRSFVFFDVL